MILDTLRSRLPTSAAAGRRPAGVRDVVQALAFLAAYLFLDRVSYIHPMQAALGITPWNPQPALVIALFMVRGQRWFPVVACAIFSAEVLVRHAPFPWLQPLVVSCVLALGYAAIAHALTGPVAVNRGLYGLRDVARLVAVVIAGTLATSALYVIALIALGNSLDEGLAVAMVKFWIGDCVGVLVTLPLIFMLIDPPQRVAIGGLLRRVESWLQFAAILASLLVVFGLFGTEPFKYFYFLFLPLVWVAARAGLPGAVIAMAMIQWGIILAVQWGGTATVTVFELQALQAALTITGLFLGVTVDERRRAEEALRQSGRLAAAGSMAAALAHELNQPLTALTGFAKASQLLANNKPLDAARLDQVLERLVGEAHRAADVVQKVRGLFQAGSPVRVDTGLTALVNEAVEGLRARADREHCRIEVQIERVAVRLNVDAVQIGIVLRNLVANAIEAIAADARTGGLIRITASRTARGAVRLSVVDNGPGVDPELVERIFDPFFTTKATGMGMGLAISRAIMLAHGGDLSVIAGDTGHFVLTLPALEAGPVHGGN